MLFFPLLALDHRGMPKAKRSTRAPKNTGENPAVHSPRGEADRLYRAAAECVRQRQRYAALVACAVHDDEQQAALRVACLCDEILVRNIESYGKLATSTSHREEDWFRKSTGLWAAAREYERRHTDCDVFTKNISNPKRAKLAQLTTDFDLEASALLALQHAVQAYRKAVPDAQLELTHRTQSGSRVA
jgi:Na+-transporting methylmalonyl-CoA/oxaloacetate decarboxylase gamma subunit